MSPYNCVMIPLTQPEVANQKKNLIDIFIFRSNYFFKVLFIFKKFHILLILTL